MTKVRRRWRGAGVAAAVAAAGLAGCYADQGLPPGVDPVGSWPDVVDVNAAGVAAVNVDPGYGPGGGAYLLSEDGEWTALADLWPAATVPLSLSVASIADDGTVLGTFVDDERTSRAFALTPDGALRPTPVAPFGWNRATGAIDLNDTGSALLSGSVPHPFSASITHPLLWNTATGATRGLGLPLNARYATGVAINDTGVVTGTAQLNNGGSQALRWRPPLYAPEAVPSLQWSAAVGVDDDGTVVISAWTSMPDGESFNARWTTSGAIERIGLEATAVGDDGTIVGHAYAGGRFVPARLLAGATAVETLAGPPDVDSALEAVDGRHHVGNTATGAAAGGRAFRFPLPPEPEG
jgi:hypothetical protein